METRENRQRKLLRRKAKADRKVIVWLKGNLNWVFSGIGTLVLSLCIQFLIPKHNTGKGENEEPASDVIDEFFNSAPSYELNKKVK